MMYNCIYLHPTNEILTATIKMQQRTKPSRRLLTLVSDFEMMIKKGKEEYLTEKSYIDLIYFYQDNFQIEKAFQVSDRAISHYPYLVDFYLIKAKLHLNNREAELALEIIDQGFVFHPGDRELVLLRSLALSRQGAHHASLDLLEALRSKSIGAENAEIYLHESYVYEHMKQYDLMFDSLRKALTIDPNSVDALERIWLATELAKKHDQSLELHRSLVDMHPFNSLAWYNLGHAFAYKHLYRNAIDAIEYAFLIDPDFEIAYRDSAELCVETRRYGRALSILEEYIDRFGIDAEILVTMGTCFYHLSKYPKAIQVLNKSVKIDPYDDEAYYHLGMCYQQMRDWNKAIVYYQKALGLDDKREEYYAGIAACYYAKEDFVKANFYFSKATETGPELEEHWVSHVNFLIKIGELKEAMLVIDEADQHAVSPELIYCKVICLLKLDKRSEALCILDVALRDEFDAHPVLFSLMPELQEDLDVQSLIRYYKM